MHGSGSPSAMFIVAKRQLAGPDMVSGAGPGWEEARRDAVHAAQAEEAPGPCPSDGPDRPDHHGASETAELIRTGEGTECPVCRTRTIVEYWVDDASWTKAGLPDGTCVDCFNARGPDGAELRGLYLRGSLLKHEHELGNKNAPAE